jgi:hypothetical protein
MQPVSKQRSRYWRTITMQIMFSMWSVPRCYKQDSLKRWVSCWLGLSAVKLSEVTWSSWLMSERVQLSTVSWKSACEEKTMRLVWNGHQPRTQLVEGCQLTRVVHRWLWQEDLTVGSWRISLSRSRCQETASGDCNRLRTLVCVCQWSVKCTSEWCIQVVIKSNIHSIPRL